MDINELLNLYYVQKNYNELIEKLNTSQNKQEMIFLARSYLETQNYEKASSTYAKLGMLYEFGRCELLRGNIENTKDIWKNIKDENPAILWGESLLQFINLYVINLPTFFQIRAFLEVDLDALLKAQQITYCENIVNGAHLLYKNNQETYKFIGRVFLNNNYYELADMFLQKAKDVCYVDPEVHFMLAKCYIHYKDIKKAKQALNTSIEKGYGYFPAKRLLEQIK